MNWDEIRKEFETSKITLKALAEKHDVKIGTLKSRKSREGWSREPTKKDATKKQKVATLEPVIESDDLTDKQKMFCLYYIKYFNATKAYQKAYECDYKTAGSNGYRMLKNAEIIAEIKKLKAEQQHVLLLDAQAVLQKYIDIAFADITDFVEFGQETRPELDHNLEPMIDESGDEITYSFSYVNLKNADEVDGSLITEVKKGKDGVSVKLADKMKALEFLSKYTDLMSENDRKKLQNEKLKVEIEKIKGEDGSGTQESEVAAMLRRMAGGT
ncbi:terminase small subunit [Cytobacillus oceanisediminis]|uniref:terminase small subunit n=1 Tax=Cytobacillus oceanisediminis TaxID=665099 RepID=UPI0020794551|nr:terminase small subunit [Cytobacillus oceanisediminis]USK44638.1 terminase small subunit [Cytobacillus oceanisediminis]